MVEYRITNVKADNVQLHTADASFDVERSEDGETWTKVESSTTTIKTRCTADEIAQQIYARADEIALKDATLTDVFDEVRAILSVKNLEPIKPIIKELEL